jgi:DNA polymerase-3 subunit epsilon
MEGLDEGMELSNRWIAIDFETANNRSNSACQLGLVCVEDWRVVEERVWLIRPPRMFFSDSCMRVHGITPRDCMDSPTWEKIWSEIKALIQDAVVIGHNVGFDANVLLGTCSHYGIAVPNVTLQCTRLISKRTWPGNDGHGLANVAKLLGISFQHHHALEDARASALIAIHAAEKFGSGTIEALEERLGLVRGRIVADRIHSPRTVRLGRHEFSVETRKIQPRTFRADGIPTTSTVKRRSAVLANAILARSQTLQPLAQKHLVLVGSILGLDRRGAIDFLEALGGVVQSQINMQTHFVVAGTVENDTGEPQQPSLFPSNSAQAAHGGSDLCRMRSELDRRRELGQPIHWISTRQLLAMIPYAAEIVRGE